MRERILAFMEDMHSKDASRVAEWFSKDAEVWIPPAKPVNGQVRIHALFRAMFRRYDYIRWEIVEILTVSDSRCLHICKSVGRIKGYEEYSNQVITDITFSEDGKILMLSDYFKDTSVFTAKAESVVVS